jgi:hypothetical protein
MNQKSTSSLCCQDRALSSGASLGPTVRVGRSRTGGCGAVQLPCIGPRLVGEHVGTSWLLVHVPMFLISMFCDVLWKEPKHSLRKNNSFVFDREFVQEYLIVFRLFGFKEVLGLFQGNLHKQNTKFCGCTRNTDRSQNDLLCSASWILADKTASI